MFGGGLRLPGATTPAPATVTTPGATTPAPAQARYRGQTTPAPAKVLWAQACGARSEGSAKKCGLRQHFGPCAGAPSISQPVRASRAGVRTLCPITRRILIRGQSQLGHPARISCSASGIREYVGLAWLSSSPRPSPRPCTPPCAPSRHASRPAAAPADPSLLWGPQTPHARRAASHQPAICQRYRSCQRSFQPVPKRRPSHTSTRWPRDPMRVG